MSINKIVGIVLSVIVSLIFLIGGWGINETGNVGVVKTLGTIDKEEIPSGFYFKLPFVTSVEKFNGKEIHIDLNNLTPKASDNLSLRDMDVTIYYRVISSKIADLRIKYSAAHKWNHKVGAYSPAYNLVYREARRASYEAIAKIKSLEMHKRRQDAANSIKTRLQSLLDQNDKNTFLITRVIIRSVLTDRSIEKSIQKAVANQKKLEAKLVEVQIAKKDAEIEIERAKGIAKANAIINKSLTREYLQHEINLALMKFATSGKSNIIVIPANMKGLSLITPTK